MQKDDIALAFFVLKENRAIDKGITRPPPPIPAKVLTAMKTGRIRIPINSVNSMGKSPLCSQIKDLVLHVS